MCPLRRAAQKEHAVQALQSVATVARVLVDLCPSGCDKSFPPLKIPPRSAAEPPQLDAAAPPPIVSVVLLPFARSCGRQSSALTLDSLAGTQLHRRGPRAPGPRCVPAQRAALRRRRAGGAPGRRLPPLRGLVVRAGPRSSTERTVRVAALQHCHSTGLRRILVTFPRHLDLPGKAEVAPKMMPFVLVTALTCVSRSSPRIQCSSLQSQSRQHCSPSRRI